MMKQLPCDKGAVFYGQTYKKNSSLSPESYSFDSN